VAGAGANVGKNRQFEAVVAGIGGFIDLQCFSMVRWQANQNI
jgi:hypothetical protein